MLSQTACLGICVGRQQRAVGAAPSRTGRLSSTIWSLPGAARRNRCPSSMGVYAAEKTSSPLCGATVSVEGTRIPKRIENGEAIFNGDATGACWNANKAVKRRGKFWPILGHFRWLPDISYHTPKILQIVRRSFIDQHFRVLPAEGLEPTLPKEHDFESCASANSATPACLITNSLHRTPDIHIDIVPVFVPNLENAR